MINKLFPAIAILFAVLLSGCAYQNSHHGFLYHGTDPIGNDSPFFYVATGVTGISKTSYTVRGGGAVREGLVADAKRDLWNNFPLGPNQAYANLSVDVIRTEKGVLSGGGPSISEVFLNCTISADVIEYGESSEQPIRSSNVVTLDEIVNDKSEETIVVNPKSAPKNRSEVGRGDKVEINIGTKKNPAWVEGVIVETWLSAYKDQYLDIEFYAPNSNRKKIKSLGIESKKMRLPAAK